MAIKTANTNYGSIEGLRAGISSITVFKGIPFAKPPVGDLRWREPQPPEKWDGILKAYEYKPVPCQPERPKWANFMGTDDNTVSEDCLYLNIWTPAESENESLPVAVWISGGSYISGSGSARLYDGEAFAKRGCILVTINYRVGPIGFLSHPELTEESEHNSSGNYGSLDQVAAIKWVYENIHAFGGNPNCITVFGESAGANSVMTMCNTKLTHGMIKRAIIQSTGGLSPLYQNREKMLCDAEAEGQKYLSILGVSSIEEARKLDAMYITEVLSEYPGAIWFPKTDGYLLEDGVITSIMKGKQHKIDYMIGALNNESGSLFENGLMSGLSDECFLEYAETYFSDDVQGYMESVDLSSFEERKKAAADQFTNDKVCATIAWQELELSRGGNTAYQYYYTKDAPDNGDGKTGAFHCCELPYVFQTLLRDNRSYSGQDFDLSEACCNYWTNFIKFGNPNGDGLPVWKKSCSSGYEALELSDNIRMIRIPETKNRRFVVNYMLNKAKAVNKL